MLRFFQDNKKKRLAPQPTDFYFRFRKLHKLLLKDNLDAILLVAGPQALDNQQSYRVIHWLFKAQFGASLSNHVQLGDQLSDIIIVVKKDQSHIYINREGFQAYKKYLCTVPNVKLVSPTPSQNQSCEEVDILRTLFFYKALQLVKKVGVPLSQTDVKAIEKWPIIKSFALQQIGRGFFSSNFTVLGVKQKLRSLFKSHDKLSIESVSHNTAAMLSGHIFGATNLLELTQLKRRRLITQTQINEVLQTAIDICELERRPAQACQVLFGVHTNQKGSKAQSIQQLKATHMTIEYADPYTNSRVGRTYFLTRNKRRSSQVQESIVQQKDTLINDLVYSLQEKDNQNFKQQDVLISLYRTVVSGTLECLNEISKNYKNLSASICKNYILSKLQKQKLTPYFQAEHLQVQIKGFNADGDQVKIDFKDTMAFILTPYIFTIRVRIAHVTSETDLGAILFGQSFVLQEGCFFLLTSSCQYIAFWQTDNTDSVKIQKIKHYAQFSELGKPLQMQSEPSRLMLIFQELWAFQPPDRCGLYFCQNGIRVQSNRFGWFIIIYKEIRNVRLLSKLQSQWLAFQSTSSLVAESLDSRQVLLELKGKAFDYVFNRLNKKDDPLEYVIQEQLPQFVKKNYKLLKTLAKVQEAPIFLGNQILDSALFFDFLELKQLSILASKKSVKMSAFKKAQDDSEQKVTNFTGATKLVLITGGFATGKNRLAKHFIKNSEGWTIFSLGHTLYQLVDCKSYVSSMVQFKQCIDAKTSLIAVVPAWIQIKPLIEQIEQSKAFDLINIVSKVSSNVFSAGQDNSLTCCVTNFLWPGYCQFIVLDSFNEDEQRISSLYQLLSQLSKQAKIYRTTNNVLHYQIVHSIINTATFRSAYQSILRLKYEAFVDQPCQKLQLKFIEWRVPLVSSKVRRRLQKQLMGLSRGFILDRTKISESLREYQNQAKNSLDQMAGMLFNLRFKIACLKRQLKAPHLIYLKLIHRKDQFLDEGLYQLALCGNALMQRPILGMKTSLVEGLPKYSGKVPEMGMLVVGTNLNQGELRQLLQSMTLKEQLLKDLKPVVRRQEISQEILTSLSRMHLEDLDRFYYFDGQYFRDRDGKIFVQHPEIESYAKGYLGEVNRDVEDWNEQVRAKWKNYLLRYS